MDEIRKSYSSPLVSNLPYHFYESPTTAQGFLSLLHLVLVIFGSLVPSIYSTNVVTDLVPLGRS
uniref:Uncharacterized protein n=1 Tax=Picea sitchensis TaxID=3332 RepID=A0A6B9XWQ8_PICSI|nr:hypothetical protein Q903MT_gene5838 [Picea sitchensis]